MTGSNFLDLWIVHQMLVSSLVLFWRNTTMSVTILRLLVLAGCIPEPEYPDKAVVDLGAAPPMRLWTFQDAAKVYGYWCSSDTVHWLFVCVYCLTLRATVLLMLIMLPVAFLMLSPWQTAGWCGLCLISTGPLTKLVVS